MRYMDFSQASFWAVILVALPILVCGNFISGHSSLFQKWFVLLLSLLLLGLASWQTLIIFLSVTCGAYAFCRIGQLLPMCGRRVLLIVLIPLLLTPLAYYKYGYFIGENVFMQQWDSLKSLIIPIGISFYTFQVIGFCIDTLMHDEPMPTILNYMNFCAFFPQIVAGPIERRSDLLPQISLPKMTLSPADLNIGIRYVLLGLFFKMALADNLAMAFAEKYQGNSALMVWTNNLLFTFRIYFDFAGYGLTAYGIARCLGITLRMNFLSPYTATNITEFWRRWHTSLTLWFRDYIYFPMGGSRTKRWALNIFIVFLVSGLWHGAGWNFVIWGGCSGVAMVIHRMFRNRGYSVCPFVGWCMTFGMMVFIWMFFYDADKAMLFSHLSLLGDYSAYGIHDFVKTLIEHKMRGTMVVVFLPLSFLVIVVEYFSRKKKNDPYALFLSTPACALMVLLSTVLEATQDSMFIYFAF